MSIYVKDESNLRLNDMMNRLTYRDDLMDPVRRFEYYPLPMAPDHWDILTDDLTSNITGGIGPNMWDTTHKGSFSAPNIIFFDNKIFIAQRYSGEMRIIIYTMDYVYDSTKNTYSLSNKLLSKPLKYTTKTSNYAECSALFTILDDELYMTRGRRIQRC